MRTLFRQFQEAVTRALQQLEDYVVGLSGRIDALESKEPLTQVIEHTVEIRTEQGQSIDLSYIEAQVQAMVESAIAALPTPEPGAPAPIEPPQIDYAELKASVVAWLDAESENLKGRDAEPVNYDAIVAALEEWLAANLARFIPEPIAGRPGQDGRDGQPGADGLPGQDGRDGISISQVEIIGTDLLVTYSNGRIDNVGRVVGADGVTTIETRTIPGQPGANGVGIADIVQRDNEIVIRLTDGKESRFKLPESRQLRTFGPGGGPTEVYVNQQPPLNHSAISYALIPGTNYYRQSVNVVV